MREREKERQTYRRIQRVGGREQRRQREREICRERERENAYRKGNVWRSKCDEKCNEKRKSLHKESCYMRQHLVHKMCCLCCRTYRDFSTVNQDTSFGLFPPSPRICAYYQVTAFGLLCLDAFIFMCKCIGFELTHEQSTLSFLFLSYQVREDLAGRSLVVFAWALLQGHFDILEPDEVALLASQRC